MLQIRIKLLFLLSIFCASCAQPTQVSYLNCNWNIAGLSEREPESYAPPPDANDSRFDEYVSFEFHDEPFQELGNGFELISETTAAGVLTVKRYRVTEEVSSNDLLVYLIQRDGYDGFVTIVNSEYDVLLDRCD